MLNVVKSLLNLLDNVRVNLIGLAIPASYTRVSCMGPRRNSRYLDRRVR